MDGLPFEIGYRQCLLLVLCFQKLLVCKRYLGRCSFEESVSQWENVCVLLWSAKIAQIPLYAYPIFMAILTAQHPLACWMGIIVSRSRDIDKQSTGGIHPSRINNIQFISLLAVDIMRVDFQHIVPAFWYPRRLVVEDGHVVI